MTADFLLHYRFGLLLLVLLGGLEMARAQGPTIDPTFRATSIYRPASVDQVVQQPDGKRLVLGGQAAALAQRTSMRVGNQAAGPLVRLLANSNEPDSVFTSNVRGLQGQLRFMVLLPAGQVMLVSYGTLTLGPVSRRGLLRINADGTPDAIFNANLTGVNNSLISDAVSQPDGKVVLLSNFPLLTGFSSLLRLLPDGAPDTAFQAAAGNALAGVVLGTDVTLQSDGKLLVPGNFGNRGLIRLLPTGAPDASFSSLLALPSSSIAVSQAVTQPDGKTLVTLANYSTITVPTLVRLTATGALDPTFQSTLTGFFSTAFPSAAQVQVQPDGKLLVQGGAPASTIVATGPLMRLLPDGNLDTSFISAAALGTAYPNFTQLLPSGQILAVKSVGLNDGAPIFRLVLLNADGSLDPSLQPRLFTPGLVNDVVQLPGGGYLVGGNFTEINGVAAGYLARLSATGVPDPTFSAAADNEVRSLLVQPDGKLLVGGNFEHLAGGNQVALGRLLPSGALDAGFAPPFQPTTYSLKGGIGRIAQLPDGRVLAAGVTRFTSTGVPEKWLRLLDATTGQPDLSISNYDAQEVLVQPNGKAVVAGFYATSNSRGLCIFRLLSNGAIDPTFYTLSGFRSGLGAGPVITSLAQGTSGELYFTSYSYTDVISTLPGYLYALSPDGEPLLSASNTQFGQVKSLALQPNGRLLVGTDLTNTAPTYGLSRRLSTLAPDPSFIGANGPLATVNRLLVQPDGAIMVAGSFTSVGGQAITGLVRLLDVDVPSGSGQQPSNSLQAWPVPVHGPLHLTLDAASQPQRVELLDGLGRVALSQATSQAEITLDTTPLVAGVYVLRVQYASGPVSRRVVVE